MKFPFGKLKLRSKIALFYIILGFLIVMAVNLVWFLPSLTEIKQNAAALELEIAKRGAEEIESFMAIKIESLEKLAYFLGPEEVKGREEAMIERFSQQDQAFFEITFIDRSGQEKIKVSRFEIFGEPDLINQSDSGYFQKALAGDVYISEVFFSEKAEPFLIVSLSIYSPKKEVSGVLAAKLNLRETWQVISGLKTGEASHAFVVDDRGRLIADPNPSLVLKNLVLINLEPIKKVVQEKKIVDGLSPEDRYKNEQGEQMLVVGVPLEKLGWGLMIERSEQEAYAGLTDKIVAFVII